VEFGCRRKGLSPETKSGDHYDPLRRFYLTPKYSRGRRCCVLQGVATFRDNISVTSSIASKPRSAYRRVLDTSVPFQGSSSLTRQLDCLATEMGRTFITGTSLTNCQSRPRNIPEEDALLRFNHRRSNCKYFHITES